MRCVGAVLLLFEQASIGLCSLGGFRSMPSWLLLYRTLDLLGSIGHDFD